MEHIHLDDLRSQLIRLEETIIFAIIERAQFKSNQTIYDPGGISIPSFDGSFLSYLLYETECVHAKVRRYTSPDEHPFYSGLPEPVLEPIDGPQHIKETSININDRILDDYIRMWIPEFCESGDDGHYGSSATCDVTCLQALSKRIHYGKYVAESKFQQNEALYTTYIKTGDEDAIMSELTNLDVEKALLRRVELKASTYGRDITGTESEQASSKINPEMVVRIYEEWIIPLTKKVEVLYLLDRLDG